MTKTIKGTRISVSARVRKGTGKSWRYGGRFFPDLYQNREGNHRGDRVYAGDPWQHGGLHRSGGRKHPALSQGVSQS